MIRDEVVVVGSHRPSYEPFSGANAELKGEHGQGPGQGHRKSKDSTSSATNTKNKGNVLANIVDFFAGLGKKEDKRSAAAAADTDRADAVLSTTPLTAHDSDPGEDCCSELHDNDPGPLLDPRWSIYPPIAGGKQRRRASKPVEIKRAPGARARAPRPPEPPAGGECGNVNVNIKVDCTPTPRPERREGGGDGGEEDEEEAGDDAERKIKAWQRRRMATKRESFTVRESKRNRRRTS